LPTRSEAIGGQEASAAELEDDEPALTMLETVREYAEEQLVAHGVFEGAKRAHAHYFLALAEQAALQLKGRDQRTWPIPPFLLQTPDNPEGLPASLFDQFMQAAREDSPAWMKGFLDSFYNIEKLRGGLVSEQAYQASWNLAVTASATAAVACIPTWETDFRADLAKIDVPMLIIQGDDDQVLPYSKTGERLARLISDAQTVVISGGPHAIAWTHADQINRALLKLMT
jgi:pimeloyl-ACP methyl ester carboxylesterase